MAGRFLDGGTYAGGDLLTVEERIRQFNQENAPFYLVAHDGKSYSLCLALSFLPEEYEDFGQAAFNRYAEKIGDPIMKNGLFTHGNGYEWEAVFKKYFESDPDLSKIRFDCEGGGFFCDADDLAVLEDMGKRFREVCMDTSRFTELTVTALQEAAVREEQESEMRKTVRGFLTQNPQATVDLVVEEGHIRLNPEQAKALLESMYIKIMDSNTGVAVQYLASEILDQKIQFQHAVAFGEEHYTIIAEQQGYEEPGMDLSM